MYATEIHEFVNNEKVQVLQLVSYLSISFNIVISWVYSLNGFRNMFSIALRVQPKNNTASRYGTLLSRRYFVERPILFGTKMVITLT